MSGWMHHTVPLLILPALVAGCQTPSRGRIGLDLPVLRTARVDAAGPWFAWRGERGDSGAEELTGRAQFASAPDAGAAGISMPVGPREATAEPRRLPEPVRQPIPIEQAERTFPTELFPQPAESDWILPP